MSADKTMTNCDDYRQAISEVPNFDGGAEHLVGCAECQAFRDEMQAFDLKLRRAMSLEVPELVVPELPDLEAANVVSLADRRRVTAPTWLAIAATVVLAAFVGVRMTGNNSISEEDLAAEVLAHVTHEPTALRITDQAVQDDKLHQVVPANIAEMDRSAGLITFAETCPINGNEIPHLVIQGKRGPITILLLPDEKISAAVPLDDADHHGVMLPVGDGSVAIIGVREEKLEDVQKQVLRSVTWST